MPGALFVLRVEEDGIGYPSEVPCTLTVIAVRGGTFPSNLVDEPLRPQTPHPAGYSDNGSPPDRSAGTVIRCASAPAAAPPAAPPSWHDRPSSRTCRGRCAPP